MVVLRCTQTLSTQLELQLLNRAVALAKKEQASACSWQGCLLSDCQMPSDRSDISATVPLSVLQSAVSSSHALGTAQRPSHTGWLRTPANLFEQFESN